MQTESSRKNIRLDRFIQAARGAGLKLTHQRLEIFREIAATEEHPDVDTIFKRVRRRVPTISHDTVYRTFGFLEKEGQLDKVSLFSEKARYDSNLDRHHHFVCVKCGLVKDFFSSELDEFKVPAEVTGWGDVDRVYIELRGVCRSCREI
ncbi:MAG TPA: Fur family transcriptional regulator [Candidatus Glassbacteria bacterium]|nr:Fur family transcriptional regulator [Candidatus Glassbacteria bacterium]